MLAKHYVHILKEIVVIDFNPINERTEGVKVAKIVVSLRKKLHFAFVFVFVFFFCSVLSEKAEITSQGAYHYLHFAALTSQGIFSFHLTKKGIITIKKVTVVKYIHIHTHTYLHVCLRVVYVKLSSI